MLCKLEFLQTLYFAALKQGTHVSYCRKTKLVWWRQSDNQHAISRHKKTL